MSDDDRRAARIIRAILTRNIDSDLDAASLEIVTALRGHGWRPTNAHPTPPWQPQPGEALGPDIVHHCAAQVRAALTEALERAAQTEGTHAATRGDTSA